MARAAPTRTPMTPEERKVVFASSLGTVFEWYDFYLYGSLADVIARKFFTALDPTAAFIFTLLTFSAGFLVRPVGAIVFGRLGDMIGRKYTFLVTILIMGTSTMFVGALPDYNAIGVAAPVILVALRILQGFALGGEYGGAVIYVAEHAPAGRRATYTAWIQTTATLGLFLSLLVILGVRQTMSTEAFDDWGWRIPFLLSFVLLVVSMWIRLRLHESPAFQRMKSAGKASRAPVAESFGQWKNLRVVILALFGLTAGQAVVWYTGQFYALFFLTQQLRVDPLTANLMVAASLVIGTPFFIVFGSLSDRVGRKPIIVLGCLLAALTYMPAFKLLALAANPALAHAQETAAVTVSADSATCSFQGNPLARETDFRSSCDIAKRYLAQSSVSYDNVAAPPGSPTRILIGEVQIEAPSVDIERLRFTEASVTAVARFKRDVGQRLRDAGYPARADPQQMSKLAIIAILSYLVLLVTMVYGPIAAMLVELFPTRIRYTSLSLPYHIGNGWFGGLLPTTAFAIVASTGNMYNGLWYPIAIAGTTAVVGALFLKETRDVDIYAED